MPTLADIEAAQEMVRVTRAALFELTSQREAVLRRRARPDASLATLNQRIADARADFTVARHALRDAMRLEELP